MIDLIDRMNAIIAAKRAEARLQACDGCFEFFQPGELVDIHASMASVGAYSVWFCEECRDFGGAEEASYYDC